MTVNSAYLPTQYEGNGSAEEFAFPYYVEAASHVKVVHTDQGGLDSEPVLNTDFSVSGAGEDSGVAVAFPLGGSAYSTLAGGEYLTITMAVPITQETDLANYDVLDAEVYESALDKLTRVCQQLDETMGRCPSLPVSLGLSGVELPAPDAGAALVWNATEDGLDNTSAPLSQYVTDAQTARSDALAARDQAIAAAGDNQPAVSADDTTPGYLEDKIAAGSGLDAVVDNGGGNEVLRLHAAVSPALSSDHSHDGTTVQATAGEALAFGDAVYLKSDGKYWKADADAEATMPVRLIALESIDADATGTFLASGFVRDDSWAWATKGSPLYADLTAGAVTDSLAAHDTGDIVQAVGRAETATVVFFNPSGDYGELA